MRKKLVGLAILAICLAFSCLSAQAQTKLEVVSGINTVTIASATDSVSYSNANFAGWSLSIVAGASNAPAASPFGLNLVSFTIQCKNVSGCGALDVFLSGTGFSQVLGSGGLISTYNGNLSGSGASTSQLAWDDNSDAFFGTGTPVGSVGPFTIAGIYSGFITGGGPTVAPYSLTLEDIFNGNNGAKFTLTGGGLSATPEPTSMLLMGSGLLAIGAVLRRKKRAAAASV